MLSPQLSDFVVAGLGSDFVSDFVSTGFVLLSVLVSDFVSDNFPFDEEDSVSPLP